MLYRIGNGPMPTTAAFATKDSTTSIKTMLQLKPFNVGRITAWGISFDGFAAAQPGKVELVETGTIFATVTASADVDIFKTGGGDQAAASVVGLTLGTTATGYAGAGASAGEGSIVATKELDFALLPPTAPYVYQFPLGAQPLMLIGNAYRIRVTFGTTVNLYCWIEFDM